MLDLNFHSYTRCRAGESVGQQWDTEIQGSVTKMDNIYPRSLEDKVLSLSFVIISPCLLIKYIRLCKL